MTVTIVSGQALSSVPVKFSATAPGKAVLLGEYSVLQGAPALSIAVDREVRVDVSAAYTGRCSVAAPRLSESPARFTIGADGKLLWRDERLSENFRLLDLVIDSLSEWDDIPSLPPESAFDLVLDSTALFHDEGTWKLGLGSSAALTVALVHALQEYTGTAPLEPGHWLPILVKTHRALQSGRGSGVDIATSLYGGAIEYQLIGMRPAVEALALPGELVYVFVWTGQSASTAGLLEQLDAWRNENVRKFSTIMDHLGAIAAEGIAAVKGGDCNGFLSSVDRFSEFLDSLGSQASLNIFSPPHRALSVLAMKSGLVYKPCGAGSGDLGVAMGTNVNDIDRFTTLAGNSGYKTINMTLNPNGVQTIRSW